MKKEKYISKFAVDLESHFAVVHTSIYSNLIYKKFNHDNSLFMLLTKPVVNCDETGARVNGKMFWVHSACDPRCEYLSLQPKRGEEGMNEADPLPYYKGTIVHDCWSPYWSFNKLEHGLCCAHLLRELQGVTDSSIQITWAKSMQQLLLNVNNCRKETVSSGKTEVHTSQIASFIRRYSIILRKARICTPVGVSATGRCKKGKSWALVGRLIKYKNEVCKCISDLRVPSANNLAGQSICALKIKTDVSGCFRTVADGLNYVTSMFYLHTAMKHNISAYSIIRKALAG